MTNSPAMLDILSRFATTMAANVDINDVLYELCDHAVTIAGATGAGVCLGNDDAELRFVTATSEASVTMERSQEANQQGPCVEAFRTGAIVKVSDIHDLDQWPAYQTAAAEVGIRAVVGIPMSLNGRAVGALNVYDAKPRPWSRDDVDTARLLADIATVYLLRAGELAEARQLAAQLQHALESRIVIEQAKGMIARDHRVSVDEAFNLLRDHSRTSNVSLRLIADAVVKMGLQIPAPDSPP